MKGFSTELFEQAAHISGLTVAHQAGVDINSINAICSQRFKAKRVGDGGIHAAADKKENVAIGRDSADFLFERPDTIFWVPILLASTNAENKIRQYPAAFRGVYNFGMKLD